eukprot:scaffold25066_cov57-Phaeocystis_antarctica.AAC.1
MPHSAPPAAGRGCWPVAPCPGSVRGHPTPFAWRRGCVAIGRAGCACVSPLAQPARRVAAHRAPRQS